MYFGNPLLAFMQGIDMDYRVKLAAEMMRNGATSSAQHALDQATHLVELAEARGLLRPLMEGDEIPDEVRMQLLRELRTQAFQQGNAQRMAQEEAPKLTHPSQFPPRRQQ